MGKTKIKLISVPSLLLLCFIAAHGRAQSFDLRKVADRNTPIPDSSGNFAWFHCPKVSGSNVVFIAEGSSDQQGIYLFNGNTLTKVADRNTPIPGGTGNFSVFFYPPAIIGRNVAFWASGASGQRGIYLFNGTTINKVVDDNTPVPGGTGNFYDFSYTPAITGNNVVFSGTGGSQSGIYLFNGSTLSIIADHDTPIPGSSGSFIGFYSPVISGSNVAFEGYGASDQQGIYLFDGTTLSKVADRETPIPGGSGKFAYLGPPLNSGPVISGSNVAFLGADSSLQQGIYLFNGATLSKIADTNTPIPDWSGNFQYVSHLGISGYNVVLAGGVEGKEFGFYFFDGTDLSKVVDIYTPIPGGSGNFHWVQSPAISDRKLVFDGENSSLQHGTYLFNGSTLSKIADRNTPIPEGFGNFTFAGSPVISGSTVVFGGSGASDQAGLYLATIPAFSQEVYKFELMWGSYGTGDGQFNNPGGVAVDSSGNVYVADTGNSRIQKFDSNGNFVTKWGSDGTMNGQFKELQGVAVDSKGSVYVSDTIVPLSNGRIQKFDSDGNFISKLSFPSNPAGPPVYFLPFGIAADSAGNVYAVVYEMMALPITTPAPVPFIFEFDSSGKFITKWGGSGTDDGLFRNPGVAVDFLGVAVDSSGNVYVADWGNERLQKFDSDGNFIAKWPASLTMLPPYKVALDRSGNVYTIGWFVPPFVGPTNQFRIQKFDPNGNLITEWGSFGNAEGQFDAPSGISVDSSGNVCVADSGNHRIQKFSPTVPSIILESPAINEHFNGCSLYSPPFFSWDGSENFTAYKVQFASGITFASISFEFEVEPSDTQITIPSDTWEEVMMIPGPSGGSVYWRVIGTRADGTTETSAVRSFSVGAEPAGDPGISPVSKRTRPTLTWQTNCNTKFKVWFGSESSFTRKTYFQIVNPAGAEGTISQTLITQQWMKVKLLVKNKSGSTVYWYIESWDGLGRYAKTDVTSFVLTE